MAKLATIGNKNIERQLTLVKFPCPFERTLRGQCKHVSNKYKEMYHGSWNSCGVTHTHPCSVNMSVVSLQARYRPRYWRRVIYNHLTTLGHVFKGV